MVVPVVMVVVVPIVMTRARTMAVHEQNSRERNAATAMAIM